MVPWKFKSTMIYIIFSSSQKRAVVFCKSKDKTCTQTKITHRKSFVVFIIKLHSEKRAFCKLTTCTPNKTVTFLSKFSSIAEVWNQFNGLDWSLSVKHLEFEDTHNSWLYCFTNAHTTLGYIILLMLTQLLAILFH